MSVARKSIITELNSYIFVVLSGPWRYMILSAGCLYLYKSSDDHNFSEAIPLTKFRLSTPFIVHCQFS